MKVVLSGYYGFDNVGDEAILFSIIKALRKVEDEIEITVLSNDPEFTSKTYGVAAVSRWSLKEVIKEIRASDGLISGGGSLLQDKTGSRSVIYYSAVMLIAKLLGKKFVVYAQGIGPIEKKKNQRITKFALSKASLLTVRDVESKQFLEKIGVRREISLVPDPVLGIGINAGDRGIDDDSKAGRVGIDGNEKIEQDSSAKIITVSVREWPSENPFLERIASTLDQLSTLGYQIVFVPMHGEHDENTSKNVQRLMAEQSIVASGKLSIEEKIRLIGKSKLLIGMRLHALIFAAVMDIPFTAISYDPKINAFASLCQQPVAVDVNKDNWTETDLLEVIEVQLANLPHYKANLLSYTVAAKISAQKTAEIALNRLGY